MAGKDLLTRLADAGEDALARLVETPGADRVVGYASAMRDRVDELQKKVRGIDELERRVTELERRLEEATGGASGRSRAARTPRPASGAAKKASTKAKSTGSASRRTASRGGTGGKAGG